jgi:hypothetical protein
MLVRSNKCTRCLALYKAYNTILNAVTPLAYYLFTAATNYIENFVDKDDESNKAVATLAALIKIQNDFTCYIKATIHLCRRFRINRYLTSIIAVALALLKSS